MVENLEFSVGHINETPGKEMCPDEKAKKSLPQHLPILVQHILNVENTHKHADFL